MEYVLYWGALKVTSFKIEAVFQTTQAWKMCQNTMTHLSQLFLSNDLVCVLQQVA